MLAPLIVLLLGPLRPYQGLAAIEPLTGTEDTTPPARDPAEPSGSPTAGEDTSSRPTTEDSADQAPVRTERTWVVGGFAGVSYVVNSNSPENHVNRGASIEPRTGEFTLPLVAAYVRHDASKREPWSLEIALQAGSAATALVANDPQPGGDASRFAGQNVWQHIGRANVGVRIPKARTEITAGLFNTPIGYWSFWPKDNWNHSTPWHLNAVPFVLMGGRVLQPIGERVVLHAWVTNGWQTYADLNKVPSYMGGAIAEAAPGLYLGQFFHFGPEDVDTRARAWRMLSDTWLFYEGKRFGFMALLDVMRERLTVLPRSPVALYVTGAVVPRVRVGEWSDGRVKLFLTGRGEAFWDRRGRIFGVDQLLLAATASSELRLFEHLLVRVEYRYDRSNAPRGFFYRGAATHDTDPGLARQQHAIYFALIGMFEHWFGRRNR